MSGQSSLTQPDRLAEAGERFYRERLQALLEPEQTGQFVAIEPETGRYFVAHSGLEALQTARRALPESLFYLKRIGYDYVNKIGGRSLRWQREEDR